MGLARAPNVADEALPAGHLWAEARRSDVPPRLRHGAGGVVSKKLTSKYKSGSCSSWVKGENPQLCSDRELSRGKALRLAKASTARQLSGSASTGLGLAVWVAA
jgi:hypothetical protein